MDVYLKIFKIELSLLIHQLLMKPLEWKCIAMSIEKENKKFIQHGKEIPKGIFDQRRSGIKTPFKNQPRNFQQGQQA